jgi:hypothetical protein
MRTIFAILLAVVSNTNLAFAATQEQMLRIAQLVISDSVPALHRKQYLTERGESNGYQAIFLCDENRYTVYYSGVRPAGLTQVEWLSFSIKRVGTYGGVKDIEMFTDYEADGTVDYGIDSGQVKRFVPSGSHATGDEHKAYWQRQLDDTVATLLRCHQ